MPNCFDKIPDTAFTLTNARVYNTAARAFVPGSVTVENGVVVKVGALTAGGYDLGGMRLMPGMVDVHTHGRVGFDFPFPRGGDYDSVLRSYAAAGTTSILATMGTYTTEQYADFVKMVKEHPQGGGRCHVDGIHFEGRWISEKRKGAHNPKLLVKPDAAEIGALLDLADGMINHVTFAPELDEGCAFLRTVLEHGATAGVGHSDASFAEASDAVLHGCTSFTHLFNAMRPWHHRDPGCVGAGLLSHAYVEMICDGYHLHPDTVKLVSRGKPLQEIVLITDSGLATGLPDGTYTKGFSSIIVKDGHVTLPDGTIAGSTLSLYDGLRNFSAFTGVPMEEAIPCATLNPARMTGQDRVTGSIRPGLRADFIVADENYEKLAVCAGGVWVK